MYIQIRLKVLGYMAYFFTLYQNTMTARLKFTFKKWATVLMYHFGHDSWYYFSSLSTIEHN